MNAAVLFTPAEYALLPQRNLQQTICVVFDILRATSTMMTALAAGATAIVPVSEIDEALKLRQDQPGLLLAGERQGLRITKLFTGGVEFDLGNSPREFTPDAVAQKTIAMTTTNGTRALRACSGAHRIVIGTFLGMNALSQWLLQQQGELLLVCSGTHENASYEDTLAAGALCDLLWPHLGLADDSALIAREIYLSAAPRLAEAAESSRNARRLLSIPELRDDVKFCLQRDTIHFVAELTDQGVKILTR